MSEAEIVVATGAMPQNLGMLPEGEAADQVVRRGAAIATSLAKVIEQQRLFVSIQGRKYIRFEGWATLGAMLGVVVREVRVVRLEQGYEAEVELVKVGSGEVISRASALCLRDEPRWQDQPEYAIRSMAVTRAAGKAFRLAFAWIVGLAGYEGTPAEEVEGVVEVARPASPPRTTPARSEAKPVQEADRAQVLKRYQHLLGVAGAVGLPAWPMDTVSRLDTREMIAHGVRLRDRLKAMGGGEHGDDIRGLWARLREAALQAGLRAEDLPLLKVPAPVEEQLELLRALREMVEEKLGRPYWRTVLEEEKE